MSISNILVPNDLSLYCGSLTANDLNVVDLTVTDLNANNATITNLTGTTANIGTVNVNNLGNLTLATPVSIVGPGVVFPSSGAPTQGVLSYYENNFTMSMTFGGIWASPQTTTISLTRLGSIVQLIFPTNVTAPVATTTVITNTGSLLPTRFIPATSQNNPIIVLDSGVPATPSVCGFILISTTGLITISSSNDSLGRFTASGGGNSGIYQQTITYSLN